MKFPTKSEVEALRKQYPVGAKVVLKKMDDLQAPPKGTKGVVTGVDDVGTVHIAWDTGSCLGFIPGEDEADVI